jgi:hypothetical protein
MREIDLRLESLCFGASGARGPCALSVAGGLKMGAHLLCFMVFKRAGMRLLLGDAHFGQHIEDCFAFYFQLSRQIVNSNLTHPPLCPSGLSR